MRTGWPGRAFDTAYPVELAPRALILSRQDKTAASFSRVARVIVKVHRILLLIVPLAAGFAADTPAGCLGAGSLGKVRISVYRPDKSVGLPIKDINALPREARLMWEPMHLPARSADKSEVAILVAPHGGGKLVALPPSKARNRVVWDLPPHAGVIALVLGPAGLNMGKVKSLVANNEDLLAELADYAQQTSQVEALIQGLADSEASGAGTEAALKGFSSRWGVTVPKLDSKASSDQQAVTLLTAVMPAANAWDPLASSGAQMQQTGGLAASVAGLFFGNTVGLAAGGTALVTNLKAMLFPNTEFRSAFAQSADAGALEFCARNPTAKSRTQLAYLWAYRVPDTALPVAVVTGPGYVPEGAKSTIRLKTAEGSGAKDLSRAKDWRLTPLDGGPGVAVSVTAGAPESLDLDLTKVKVPEGDYQLTADWDWDRASLGKLHVRPFGDLRKARVAPASQDELTQGSGVVTAKLTGADFEFVEKVEVQKAAAKAPKPAAAHFDLPKGARNGAQPAMDVDIDTASAGAYQLLISQADGVKHTIPVTVLPPNPKVTNLPVHVNVGEAQEAFRLRGSGLDRVESVKSGAGAIEGKGTGDAWAGTIRLGPGVKAGQKFSVAMKVQGVDDPATLTDAIEVVGPRPKIDAVKKSVPGDLGIEMAANELPAGTSVGLVLAVEHLRETGDARPQVELNCRDGEQRKPLALSPDEHASGGTLSFAGPDSLYLSVDPGVVGYAGCDLVAKVSAAPRGTSDETALGRVVRFPQLEKFTLTTEALGTATYAGILKGRDLDMIEKAGWDAQNGLPVVGIPTPVPGDATRQTLRIAVPWPSPAPHAPLYIWLRGESSGRRTAVSD